MRMTTGDQELAQAAAHGDRDAFACLLKRHYDRLFGLCFRLTGTRDAAEDLTQDICLALPAKLASFRGDAKFSTWLYRITCNAAHDRRRRAMTHAKAAKGWGDWEINRQAAISEGQEALTWLQTAMTALPDDLRDTAVLTMGDEMTHAEAAEILGVSEGTISWRLSEIRKRLRAIHEREQTE